jgi:hypothetical protein
MGRIIEPNEREAVMEATLSDTLTQRVEDLIESHHHEKLLTTTSARVVMHELVERNDGLEQAVRELAQEVQELAARVEQTSI